MLNHVIIVGRVSNFDINDNSVTLAVPRSFRNKDGIYETDYIPAKLWKGVASQLSLVNIGDIIGVRGRLERVGVDLKFVGEKITFLAPGKMEEVHRED